MGSAECPVFSGAVSGGELMEYPGWKGPTWLIESKPCTEQGVGQAVLPGQEKTASGCARELQSESAGISSWKLWPGGGKGGLGSRCPRAQL